MFNPCGLTSTDALYYRLDVLLSILMNVSSNKRDPGAQLSAG